MFRHILCQDQAIFLRYEATLCAQKNGLMMTHHKMNVELRMRNFPACTEPYGYLLIMPFKI